MIPLLRDSSWVRQSFLVSNDTLEIGDQLRRVSSTVSLKFTDTTLGGNFAINPAPQFTSNADIKAPGKFAASKGMGRYYSEAIDDNQQLVYMRFGVPSFNSLTTFFTSFYDSGASELARTGRNGGFFFKLGQAAAAVVIWQELFIITAIQLLGIAIRFYAQKPSSKFYYLKPTMPLYWNTVQTIVNRLAVNRGIIPPPMLFKDPTRIIDPVVGSNPDTYAKLMPELFNSTGGINVFSMAGRAQRLSRLQEQRINDARDKYKNGSLADIETAMVNALNQPLEDKGKRTYQDYLAKWFGSDLTKSNVTGTNSNGSLASVNTAANAAPTPPSGSSAESVEGQTPSFEDFFMSELDDGSAFACFRVNATGHMTESFSNNVAESELATKINGMSSQSRETNFNFAGGNLVDIPGVSALVGAVKDMVSGAVDVVGMSGLASLAGSAFVDIPKHWQSSIASLPRANYSINLVSPYGNPISQMMNLDVPLAMILAGCLPMATGKQSFTSPFICELYDQGRCQIRLGMIDSVSITRGTGNLGFTSQREGANALGIDISFSVVDMSSIMYLPITEGFSMEGMFAGAEIGAISGALAGGLATPGPLIIKAAGAAAGAVGGAAVLGTVGAAVDFAGNIIKTINNIYTDDTAFNDYLAVLAGMPLRTQIYSSSKISYNVANAVAQWKTFYTNAAFASFAGNRLPAKLVSHIFRGVTREVPK